MTRLRDIHGPGHSQAGTTCAPAAGHETGCGTNEASQPPGPTTSRPQQRLALLPRQPSRPRTPQPAPERRRTTLTNKPKDHRHTTSGT